MPDQFSAGHNTIRIKIDQLRARVKHGWGTLRHDPATVSAAEDALTISTMEEWQALPQAERDARLACLLNTL